MGPKGDSFEKAQGGEPVSVPFQPPSHIDRPPVRISVAEGYRLWSQTYDLEPNPLLTLEFRTLSHKLEGLSGKIFLDVGCGTGRWMVEAVSRRARTIGLDLCREMLLVAAGKSHLTDRLVQADIQCLPLRAEIADMVMCSFCLGYIRPVDQVLAELCRVTRHGGTVLVSDFHPGAHQAGWRRSFRSGSDVFEIESYCHTADQLVDAGRMAGMRLKQVLEPGLGEPERHIMRGAGKMDLLEQVSGIPAVLIIEWQRG